MAASQSMTRTASTSTSEKDPTVISHPASTSATSLLHTERSNRMSDNAIISGQNEALASGVDADLLRTELQKKALGMDAVQVPQETGKLPAVNQSFGTAEQPKIHVFVVKSHPTSKPDLVNEAPQEFHAADIGKRKADKKPAVAATKVRKAPVAATQTITKSDEKAESKTVEKTSSSTDPEGNVNLAKSVEVKGSVGIATAISSENAHEGLQEVKRADPNQINQQDSLETAARLETSASTVNAPNLPPSSSFRQITEVSRQQLPMSKRSSSLAVTPIPMRTHTKKKAKVITPTSHGKHPFQPKGKVDGPSAKQGVERGEQNIADEEYLMVNDLHSSFIPDAGHEVILLPPLQSN